VIFPSHQAERSTATLRTYVTSRPLVRRRSVFKKRQKEQGQEISQSARTDKKKCPIPCPFFLNFFCVLPHRSALAKDHPELFRVCGQGDHPLSLVSPVAFNPEMRLKTAHRYPRSSPTFLSRLPLNFIIANSWREIGGNSSFPPILGALIAGGLAIGSQFVAQRASACNLQWQPVRLRLVDRCSGVKSTANGFV
jgi:hypothetical protein